MKPSRILELIGGGLGALAFFLPWITFIIGISLLDIIQEASKLGDFSSEAGLVWIEPLAAVALFLFALLASTMGKSAHALSLISALVGLGFVIYLYVRIQLILNSSTVISGVVGS